MELEWDPRAAACVVASSRGYPGKVDDGKEISGLFADEEDCVVFQAGTRAEQGKVFTKGGRILCVSAFGENTKAAVARSYQGLKKINFDGIYYRNDIGGGA